MNKKERRLALATALQSASSDILVVESLAGQVQDKKTKSLLALLAKVGVTQGWCDRMVQLHHKLVINPSLIQIILRNVCSPA